MSDDHPTGTTPAAPARSRRGCWVGAALLLLALAAIVVLVVPNFIHFAARSKQSEAKQAMKSLYTAQMAYQQEKDGFSVDADELGFSTESGNRYAVFLAPEGRVRLKDRQAPPPPDPKGEGPAVISEDRFRFNHEPFVPLRFVETGCPVTPAFLSDGRRAGLGVTGEGAEQVFVGAAVGQIDNDPDLDCWSVATVDRKDRDGKPIPRGTPYLEASDVR